jgi:spore germination cell wall hydrolase CwlJ-like protein
MAFGGVMLVMAFAFAGHYMGQNAIAHNAEPDQSLSAIMAPSSNIIAKGSLMPEGTGLEIVNLAAAKQQLAASGKGDIPGLPQKTIVGKTTGKIIDRVQIVPASVDLRETNGDPVKKKIALAPSKSKVEESFKLKRSEKPQKSEAARKVIAQRRVQMAEENCLARAVYFEARSESELGQLAVAKVILNRVKDPEYPNTICGVVYQGSGRRNSCQFSFACDGLPDDVRSASAWANSKRIAQKALAGDAKVSAIGTATNYHADYVRPKWAKSMKRLIKIGRHVFYEDS